MPCPLCQYEFEIPKGGVARLTVKKYDFSRNIDNEIKQISLRIERFRLIAAQVEIEKENLHATRQEIMNKGAEIKQSFICLVDRQVSDLLDKLQSTAETEIESRADAAQLALTELESCSRNLLELKSKVSPSDKKQAASDVYDELLKKHVIPGEYHAPSYTFIRVDTDKLLRDQNFIGNVVQVYDPGMH